MVIYYSHVHKEFPASFDIETIVSVLHPAALQAAELFFSGTLPAFWKDSECVIWEKRWQIWYLGPLGQLYSAYQELIGSIRFHNYRNPFTLFIFCFRLFFIIHLLTEALNGPQGKLFFPSIVQWLLFILPSDKKYEAMSLLGLRWIRNVFKLSHLVFCWIALLIYRNGVIVLLSVVVLKK